jgi:glycosyltransferase involved in cell wall biosynthesis
VTFFLDEPHPTPGAPWTRISSFAKSAAKKRYAVDVIGIFSPKNLRQKGGTLSGGINILNLIFKIPLPDPLLYVFNFFVSFISSAFLLIGRRPRIAIVSFPGGDSSSGFLLACRLLGIKTVVDYRDEWENQLIYSHSKSDASKRFYTLIKKLSPMLYYRQACFVSVVTKPFVTALSQSGLSNVVLVPNGASVSSFKPIYNKPNNGLFTIVYSGGVGEYYRLDVVVSSMKKLADRGLRNIRLIIVGRGTNGRILNNLLSYARDLGLQDSVLYLGNKNNIIELSGIIASANVGIVPYDDNPLWKNGLPAKFWEYCACGLPIIATVFDDSILADLIHQKGIGLTANPLDADGLASKIEKLSLDKDFCARAGQRARLLIEQEFNRDKISEDFIHRVSTSSCLVTNN